MRGMNLKRTTGIATLVATGAIALAACGGGDDARAKETKSNQDSYQQMVSQQPGYTMKYSPTRDTINFWAKTWDKPNKLAYVYLMNGDGKLVGYYILKGPPVTSCAALKPTVKVESDSDGKVLVPQPSVDGVYYSGGQCNAYYGKDATTGAYVEWHDGLGLNPLLYDQPLPDHPNVPPLGPSKLSDIKH